MLRSSISLLALTVAGVLGLGCAATTDAVTPDDSVESAATNGRVGQHGMVVFGTGQVFFSHIPMFAAPHDVQLVFEASLSAPGSMLPPSFADQLYTFQPARFSLDALRSGALTTITGTLFMGNFEAGGRPIARNVTVTATRVLLNKVLKTSDPAPAKLEYFAVGTPAETYLVHRLGGPPSFDQILVANAHAAGAPTALQLKSGVSITLTQSQNAVGTRFLVGNAASSSGTFTAVRELSCLVGPDFFDACL